MLFTLQLLKWFGCNLHLKRLCVVINSQQGSEIIVYCIMSLMYMGCKKLCSFAPGVLHGATSSKALVLWVANFAFYLIAGHLQFSTLLRMNEQPAKTLSTLGCFKWDCAVTDQYRGGLVVISTCIRLLEGSCILASSVWNKKFRWSKSKFGI